MPYPGGEYEAEDELDDVEEEHDIRSSNDHCIILIDARRNMFEAMENPEAITPFEASLRAAIEIMKNKVVRGDKHRVGVTLFGTRNPADKDDSNPNVWVVADLAPPSAERIRAIDSLEKGEVSFDKQSAVWGSEEKDGPSPLRSGLCSCHSEFMAIKQPQDFKRIFLFTNDDDPTRGDNNEEKKLQIVAKDAVHASIEIQLFHLKKSDGTRFDTEKFYRAILSGDGDDYNDKFLGEGCGDPQELMRRVRRKEFKKRRLARLPFYLREGLEEAGAAPAVAFDVQLFNMVHPAKRPNPIHLDKRTNRPMQIISKLMDDKTGAQLDDHEIRTFLEFAGEKTYISADEMAGLKALFPKGITLLGFKPLQSLRPDFNVRSPYFLYPDEESTTGSAKAFVALHAAMMSKKVYALARFTRAIGAAPRIVALLPQEELEEDGAQLSPPGLHAVVLPFADEVREAVSKAPKEEKEEGVEGVNVKTEVSVEGVQAAEGLVRTLRLEAFDCHQFENPALQRHYAALQAIALSEESIGWDPKKDDTTRPDEDAVDAAATPFIDAFKATYQGDEEDDMKDAMNGTRAKRSAGGGSTGGSSKRVKSEGDGSSVNWQEALAKDQIGTFTLPTLKGFLKSRGLAVGGKKSDLVDRVSLALQQER